MVLDWRPAHLALARHGRNVLPVVAVAFVYTVVMAGGTLTIPLYVLWQAEFGFRALTTVFVFVAYVVGAVGTLFRHGLGVTDALCDPGNRAELNATYFLFLYSGLVIPVLLNGLVDRAVGSRVSSTALAALVVVTATVGLALGGPGHRTSTPDTTEENHD